MKDSFINRLLKVEISGNDPLAGDMLGRAKYANARQSTIGWEDIRGEAIADENSIVSSYKCTAPTHVHTIDPAKSELYRGQQQTFVAPYTCCDCVADNRTAWAQFDKIFNNK